MLRTYLGSVLAMALVAVCLARAADDTTKKTDKDKKQVKATITKVDPKAKTVTVKMKDKEGKEVEKTFKLAEDILYFDSTGKVAAVDIFKSGDDILVIEEEGKLKEMRKDMTKPTDKKDK
jgi:uncharacterized protein YuzE